MTKQTFVSCLPAIGLRLPVVILLLLASSLVRAEADKPDTNTDLPDAECAFPPIKKKPLQGKQAPPDRTQLQADEADMSSKDATRFSGSVIIQRGERRIEADSARYHHATEDFDAQGNIRFFDKSTVVEGDKAHMNLKDNHGFIDNAQYQSLDKKVRGTAGRLTVDGPGRLVLKDGTYTSCRPDDVDWELSASEITLDSDTRQGTASHVVVDFMGVPFLYLPYLRFPLGDQRMSGLLYPSFGTSDEHGTEISIPYYWNIAPNLDATITPHNMTRRGTMLENEFRYLTENSHGQIDLHYLGDDKVYQQDRRQFSWEHTGNAVAGWSTRMNYKEVSDIDYLTDFGGSLGSISTTHLEQRADLSYNSPNWLFTGMMQNFQVLNGTEPYRRLPQLRLSSRFMERDNRLNFNFSSEWVRFEHRDVLQLPADRFNLQPVLSLPLRSEAFFFIPRVTGHYTRYQLDEMAAATDKEPERSLPIYSLDTGLFMERDTGFGDTPLLQTFEPRLFYVYVPYREQSEVDLPVFDSGLQPFSFNTLFLENRFSSVDRVGDTNHLAAILTTRFLNQASGVEMFSASLGQITYFDDRRVTLPGGSAETDRKSSYVARIAVRPSTGWSFSSDLQWDPQSEKTEYSTNRLTYRSGKDLLFNLGYRYRVDELETRDASLVWRINPRWRILASSQYDLRNQHNLESVYGFDYNSCCWGLRLLFREYYNVATPDEYDKGLFLSLELKGLSSFGHQQQARTILQNAIPGYQE